MTVATKQKPPVKKAGGAVSLREKFMVGKAELTASLIDREDEVALTYASLVAKQHLLLVGPPGTAKSLCVDSLKNSIIGARKCVVHCNKDTTRGMAFGPVKVSSLQKDKYERVLDGGAADCHFLVMEECYKAGPAVLDMFLLLMNERRYQEGVFHTNSPLIQILGVSNEWAPEGCEAALAAFADRFLFRKEVKPIRSRRGVVELLERARANDDCRPTFTHLLTLGDVESAHKCAMEMVISPPAMEALIELVFALRKEGVEPGDRRIKQSLGAVRAWAWMEGSNQVEVEHLEVLAHILWSDPTDHPKKCRAVVQKIANPLSMAVASKLADVEDVLAKCAPGQAEDKLLTIQKELALMRQEPRVIAALDYVGLALEEVYEKVRPH